MARLGADKISGRHVLFQLKRLWGCGTAIFVLAAQLQIAVVTQPQNLQ